MLIFIIVSSPFECKLEQTLTPYLKTACLYHAYLLRYAGLKFSSGPSKSSRIDAVHSKIASGLNYIVFQCDS